MAAREVVDLLCERGYAIASGGTVKGTMGVICDQAATHNVGIYGVMPRFMKGFEHPALTSLKWVDTMSERKQLMREGCSVIVALPGGIGTLDELIETLVLRKLHQYDGLIVAYNYHGFYEPLKALLDHYVATNMLDPKDRELIAFPSTPEELGNLL